MRFQNWLVFVVAGVLGCSSCSPHKRGGGAKDSKHANWTPASVVPSVPPLPGADPAAPPTEPIYRLTPEATTPVTGHPRLIVRQTDLARIRSWAVPDNPIFVGGLDTLAKIYRQKMDSGEVEKDTGYACSGTPTEGYAEIFAFMSLIHSDEGARANFAKRSRTMLMKVIDKAALGQASGKPFRDKKFPIDDRSRWYGEGFLLTVDWIYGTLTTEDKATIRKVFLRWAEEILHAETTTHNHPEPIGVVNDPKLTSDRTMVRWAINNYYAGHIRNLALMALSFDPADDPGEKLRGYLSNVTGALDVRPRRALPERHFRRTRGGRLRVQPAVAQLRDPVSDGSLHPSP